jgi:hypothetical protein
MTAMNFAPNAELQSRDRLMCTTMKNRNLTILAAAAILALLAKPACAQDTTIGNMTPEVPPEQKALDKAYKDTMDKLPNPKPKSDPWGNVRAVTPSKDPKDKQSSGSR